MSKYGYARVSTQEQSTDRQYDIITGYGVLSENIYSEKISGTITKRPQLERLKEKVQQGDIVYIESLNRLGRSAADLLSTLNYFKDKGVLLVSNKESIDTSTAAGTMMVSMLAVLAEFERNQIAERVREGVAAARKRGRVGGRPRIDPAIIKRAKQMYTEGSLSTAEICRVCGIGKSTFFRYVHGNIKKVEQYDDTIDLDE